MTHCLVFASLIVYEKDHGVHAFIVPLPGDNDDENFDDIQKDDLYKHYKEKINDDIQRLKRVKVPLANMLMKDAQLSADGQF